MDKHQQLKQVFGFDEFLSGQETVVDQLLAGHSSAAVFPTGGGKSLCYQLPALMMEGTTIVVSPLIALMKDQIDTLISKGVSAARLDSSLSLEEYRSITQRIRQGELKLLYVAPERFTNERFRAMLNTMNVSLFAIDEAHCISEWGHNFRPDYLKLANFAKDCNANVILALTATATPGVLSDICRFLDVDANHAVRTPFYRSNLTILSDVVSSEDRDQTLLDRIRTRSRGPTIVYVTLQKTAEYVAQFLKNNGLPARAYHAGLDPEFRSGVQEWFMQSDESIVVATIAFGMGIDKSNIRYVYHYNLPKSLENFAQEIGRAGRDGKPSTCETLYCVDDLSTLENFVFGDTPEAASIGTLVDDLFNQGDQITVSVYGLSRTHDIRGLVLRTLLTYMELDGYLAETTPVYSKYQFIPQMSSSEILQQFEGERRDFLLAMFQQSTKARKWFSIDLESAAAKLNCDRTRLVKALDYLAEQNMLELKPSGLVHRYNKLREPDSRHELADSLHKRMQHREQSDLARIGEVVELLTQPGCQVDKLSQHFGESLDSPCGHCSRCLDADGMTIPERPAVPIDEATWRLASQLRQATPALASPVLFTRFLCGITSPRLTKEKLSRHKLAGSLANVPFRQVLERARAE